MKSLFEYLLHHTFLKNKFTTYNCLRYSSFILTLIIYFSTKNHYLTLLFFAISIFIFLFLTKKKNKIYENHSYIKYINSSKVAYNLYSTNEKHLFYKTIINAIREKDLITTLSKKQKLNKAQTIFLSEIDSIKTKKSVLSEIDFERFNNTIKSYRGKEWIRNIFSYKKGFRDGTTIILSKLSNHPNTNNINGLIRVLVNNLNLSEDGITLNPKELKIEVDNILENSYEFDSNKENKILNFTELEKNFYSEFKEEIFELILNKEFHKLKEFKEKLISLKDGIKTAELIFWLNNKYDLYTEDELKCFFNLGVIKCSNDSIFNDSLFRKAKLKFPIH
jgi:hypothetical protein